ncbi:MAG: NAD(P)/FAD-dependent oxidoreductase [Candidatus Baltobacteraceae bacterium]
MLKNSVLVAGAGPAGSAAALLLAREGFDVTLIDRSEFPRTKPCGEYLSGTTVRMLGALGLTPVLQPHAYALKGVRVFTRGARAELPFRTPGWSLPRQTLDDVLRRAAIAAGVRAIRARAENVTASEGNVRLRIRLPEGGDATLTAGALVAADGAHSLLAKELRLHAPPKGEARFALGGHYGGLRALDRYVHMFVDGRTYFAVNPFDAQTANVMLIVYERDVRAHRENMQAFVRGRAAELSAGTIDLSFATLQGNRIAIGPLAYRATAFHAPGVLLAGDAAEFVDPFTGQGVYLALYGARLACKALLAVRAGASEAASFAAYGRALYREIARRKRYSSIVSLSLRMPFLAPCAPLFAPLLDAVSA